MNETVECLSSRVPATGGRIPLYPSSFLMVKVLTVVGARPQLVKAAVVSRELRETPGLEEIIVHTGQHYDRELSGVFFEELDIPRYDYNLGVGSASHGVQTGRMLEGVEEVIRKERPACVLVYGDTNSTLAGALAAAKSPVPVAHVEAGLRSFNRSMPEEVNRIITDHVSEILFPPTAVAFDNLIREDLGSRKIVRSGDVMYDAFLFYEERSRGESEIIDSLSLSSGEFVLATVHRAENTDDLERLRIIMEGLVRVADQIPVVMPLHPRTDAALERANLRELVEQNIELIEPVGYLDMIRLECAAKVIATDSGGVQKEAYFAGVPCVTLRGETEWTELIDAGANTLCPPAHVDAVARAILRAHDFRASTEGSLYGDGTAGAQIVETLASCLELG